MLQAATAKPTEEERCGIPHHLIDYIPPQTTYTAADWAADAVKAIADIEGRGKTAILVGGTGFYLQALFHPLFEAPKTDEHLRRRLSEIHAKKGAPHLHKMLQRFDKELAAKLFPNDYVRTIRGLEFFFQNGRKLSEAQIARGARSYLAERAHIFVLDPPRDELYAKINARTEMHFAAGLVDEVKDLLAAGIPETTSALGSHGYRRVCEYLRGERTLESAVQQTSQDVRNYAKRQVSWFKREKDAVRLAGFGSDDAVFAEMLRCIDQNP
jgi:tRNA dimethylallyltransferase